MAFKWTPHRFSGGTLAFDLANSVILRHDPARRRDRLQGIDDVAVFAAAASHHCAEADAAFPYQPCPPSAFEALVNLRETIDRHFRSLAATGENSLGNLSCLIAETGAILKMPDISARRIDAAAALSALALAMESRNSPRMSARIKLCANCGWLILDKSRNQSRTWCDMAVCGNREKAKRHYRKHLERHVP